MRYVSLTGFLALFSLLSVLCFYRATQDVVTQLSPQGCRMSYMYPSYVLQTGFDHSWTPLAKRYSLWLYRELDSWGRELDANHVKGLPVLFVPGNAGSSRQVRSIASSAATQYYRGRGEVASGMGHLKPLDFYAVEFNEDLSAFHGPTLEAQTTYAARAIGYILSLYPPHTRIILMGHSMGGIVATALLASHSANISAIFTMSTPHTLPPARFDARVDKIYDLTRELLAQHTETDTPIVSLCGGATDMMIPSESCVLPPGKLRRTVFSCALEGAWTGVGHQEMVWCHQVRWRVARAALELGDAAVTTPEARQVVLDRCLRDGHALPLIEDVPVPEFTNAELLPSGMPLVVCNPQGDRTYFLPVSASRKFVLLVSQGAIPPVAPQQPLSLVASIFACAKDRSNCVQQRPTTLKLLPSPVVGRPFPVPGSGADESEGIVLFEADVDEDAEWVGVRVERSTGSGWVVGGFVPTDPVVNRVGTLQLLLGKVSLAMPSTETFKTTWTFPNLLSNALVVYRITPHRVDYDRPCDALFAPLLQHTSQASETHYFPLLVPPNRRILLHTHASAPHVRSAHAAPFGVEFSVYSSGASGCLAGFDMSIDWSATIGRWATRYFTVIPVWATGIVAFILFRAWGVAEGGAVAPTVDESISSFLGRPLRWLLLLSVVISLVPLPESYYLGDRGEPYFALIAPLLLLISMGFVCGTQYLLCALMWPLSKLSRAGRRRREDVSVHRSTVISMALILLIIFLFVPWQVAFLGCWAIHLHNCASSQAHIKHFASIPDTVAIPLLRQDGEPTHQRQSSRAPAPLPAYIVNNHNHSMHMLLLMTWLLPLAAPVLVVWVRTLAGAGLTTPFDGDHFVFSAAPFLVLVDFASWIGGPVFEMQRFERTASVRWSFAAVSAVAFLLGSRKAYLVFDVAKVAAGLVVLVRIGPRYWGRGSWAPVVVSGSAGA
ncbi:GPI inositol-deacylase [Mycena chlorophos]|uniref:GPI inositol-deacylase n=1 Tax=Mycena chlorophos TaxID=658473 RepID=A0A8H6VUG2_MYCCL|nr:GPI inositol-deacylase [Mycena chlorophos]